MRGGRLVKLRGPQTSSPITEQSRKSMSDIPFSRCRTEENRGSFLQFGPNSNTDSCSSHILIPNGLATTSWLNGA